MCNDKPDRGKVDPQLAMHAHRWFTRQNAPDIRACVPAAADQHQAPGSQRYSFGEHTLPERGMQAGFGDDVNPATQELLGVEKQSAKRQRASAGAQRYQKVNITVVTRFTSAHRAEHLDTHYAAQPGKRQ